MTPELTPQQMAFAESVIAGIEADKPAIEPPSLRIRLGLWISLETQHAQDNLTHVQKAILEEMRDLSRQDFGSMARSVLMAFESRGAELIPVTDKEGSRLGRSK